MGEGKRESYTDPKKAKGKFAGTTQDQKGTGKGGGGLASFEIQFNRQPDRAYERTHETKRFPGWAPPNLRFVSKAMSRLTCKNKSLIGHAYVRAWRILESMWCNAMTPKSVQTCGLEHFDNTVNTNMLVGRVIHQPISIN